MLPIVRTIRLKRCLFSAALAVGMFGVGCSKREPTTLDEKPLPHVRVWEVDEIAPRPQSKHLVRLEPARRARLAPRNGGQVIAIEVDEQQQVEEGDVLVKFEGDTPRGGLISAKASIERINESLRDNERELEASRALVAKGAETTRALERLETERARLQAQLQEARGSLVQARDRVGATAIVAPFRGTITRIDTELGEYMGPGAVALVLAQLDPMAVEVPLTQDEVALYDRGGLTFEVVARGRRLKPKLEWIGTEAEAGASTFPARLRVANEDRTLRAGELVDVEVFGPDQAKLLAIPATAVRWAADRSYVLRVAKGDTVERVDVGVLEDEDGLVTISGELQIGDRVVATGPTSLLEGDEVAVVEGPSETLASRQRPSAARGGPMDR